MHRYNVVSVTLELLGSLEYKYQSLYITAQDRPSHLLHHHLCFVKTGPFFLFQFNLILVIPHNHLILLPYQIS